MHHPELPSAHSQPFLRLAWTTWPLQPERLRQVQLIAGTWQHWLQWLLRCCDPKVLPSCVIRVGPATVDPL